MMMMMMTHVDCWFTAELGERCCDDTHSKTTPEATWIRLHISRDRSHQRCISLGLSLAAMSKYTGCQADSGLVPTARPITSQTDAEYWIWWPTESINPLSRQACRRQWLPLSTLVKYRVDHKPDHFLNFSTVCSGTSSGIATYATLNKMLSYRRETALQRAL